MRWITGLVIASLLSGFAAVRAQELPTPEATPTETLTLTLEVTPTLIAVQTATPAPTTLPETTQELTPAVEMTPDPLSPTSTPVIFGTLDALMTATNGYPVSLNPTRLPGTLNGVVRYQNRAGSLSDVTLTIYALDGRWLFSTPAREDGSFTLDIPVIEIYYLVIRAPLHGTLVLISSSLGTPVALLLSGGDLDGDGCITLEDLTLLTSVYDTDTASADITRDGLVNVSDLSLLTGNMDMTCVPFDPSMLGQPMITPSPEATSEATAEVTLEATSEATAEGAPEITAVPTATETREPTVTMTATGTPVSEPSATDILTPEQTETPPA